MTKEIAEKIAKGITDKIECNTADIDDWAEFWGFTREDYEEFLDMAIKASKQTDLFNKIRAEIEYGDCGPVKQSDRLIRVTKALEIIDKYNRH